MKDSLVIDGFIRKSVLLQMIRDLQFSLGIGRPGWVKLGLNQEQEKIKKDMLPLLTPVLLFSTTVDLLARVRMARQAETGRNGLVFRELLEKYFELSEDESAIFWKFRNALSHQYIIPNNVVLYRAGSQDIIEKVVDRDLWFIYVHSMYTSTVQAKNKIYQELITLREPELTEISEFIEKHGFIKQQLKNEAKTI